MLCVEDWAEIRLVARAIWLGRSASIISGFPILSCRWGYGQTHTAKQLPVLTMAMGYSRWLSAVLYIRLDANDYSVHPAVIRAGSRSSQTVSDPAHVAAATLLRRDRIGLIRPTPNPRWRPSTTMRSRMAPVTSGPRR